MDGFDSAWGEYKLIQTLNIPLSDNIETERNSVPPAHSTQFSIATVLYRQANGRRGSEIASPFLNSIPLPIRENAVEELSNGENHSRPITKRKPLSSFSIPTLGSSFGGNTENVTRVSHSVPPSSPTI